MWPISCCFSYTSYWLVSQFILCNFWSVEICSISYAAYHMLFWGGSLKPTKVLSIGVVLYGFVYIMLYLPEEQNINGTSLMWQKLGLNKLRKIKFYWPFWKKFIKAISSSKIQKFLDPIFCKKCRFELKMNYVCEAKITQLNRIFDQTIEQVFKKSENRVSQE